MTGMSEAERVVLAPQVERGVECFHGARGSCHGIRCGSNCSSRFDRMHPCPACMIDETLDLRARLAAVEALAGEWDAEGRSLIEFCDSGRDVFEGETLKRCATNLRAALHPDPSEEIGGDECGDLLPGDENLPLSRGSEAPDLYAETSEHERTGWQLHGELVERSNRQWLHYMSVIDELKSLLRRACEADAREDCRYDHNGGCQAHGFLSEPCPYPLIRQYLATPDPSPAPESS